MDYNVSLSSPVLNVVKVLDSFKTIGRAFQFATTLLVKKFFLNSVFDLVATRFKGYDVFLVGLWTASPTKENQVELSTRSMPYRILKTFTISYFFHLSSRELRFNSINLSSYESFRTQRTAILQGGCTHIDQDLPPRNIPELI